MKKYWPLLLFIPAVILGVSGPGTQVVNLSGGINSYQSPNKIPDNTASYAQNFYFDIEPLAVERNGYVKVDTVTVGGVASVSGLWNFVDPNGNEWLIRYSSRTYYKNTIGNLPTAFGPIATTSQVPRAAVNQGKIAFVNGTDSLWYFDGTSTAAVSAAPLGKLIAPWRTRFVIGNINSAQTTLRFSADADITSWTIGGNATDPFQVLVAGSNDGQYVRCLWGTYLDALIIGRKYDLYQLSGTDQSDYEVRNISSEIGCVEPGSMREFDGSLIFLSHRGLEEMRGYSIQSISDPIRDLTDSLVKNTASQHFNTQTTQADWSAGTLSTDLSATTSPGDLATLTTSYSQTTQADWSAGTITDVSQSAYVDTFTVVGNLQLTFPDTFATFRNGTSSSKNVWTNYCYPGSCAPRATVSNGFLVMTATGTTINSDQVLRTTDRLTNFQVGTTYFITLTTMTFTTSQQSIFRVLLAPDATTTQNPTTLTNGYFYFQFTSTTTNKAFLIRISNNSDGVICAGSCQSNEVTLPTSLSIYVSTTSYSVTEDSTLVKTGTHSWAASPVYLYLDYYWGDVAPSYGTVSFDSVGIAPIEVTHMSQPLDTGIVSPVWGTFSGTAGIVGGTIDFATRVSADNVTYDGGVAASFASVITSNPKRYVKVNSHLKLTTANPASASAFVNDYTVNAGSSGTFTSQLLSIGSLISSWGPVSISDVQNGGSITYQFGSTNTASVSAITNWASIVNGGVPSVSTNSYAAFRSTLTVTNATSTSTVKISDFVTSWNEGSSAPLASWVHDRRYWLSCTTNTASGSNLDTVLVYQRNRTFTLFKGLNAASFALWRDYLRFGNSNGNGYTYTFDVGNSDDSTNITSIIKTKSYDFGSSIQDKDFRNTYFEYTGSTVTNGSFVVTYDVDRLGSAYDLGTETMNSQNGQIAAKFPFALTNPTQGRELQYTITKSGTGTRLKLHDIVVKYTMKEER